MSEIPRRLAYGIPEAASMLSIERSTLYRHAKLGRITIRKLGGRSVILSDDLAAYLRELPILGAPPKEHRLIHQAKRRPLKAAFAFSLGRGRLAASGPENHGHRSRSIKATQAS